MVAAIHPVMVCCDVILRIWTKLLCTLICTAFQKYTGLFNIRIPVINSIIVFKLKLWPCLQSSLHNLTYASALLPK